MKTAFTFGTRQVLTSSKYEWPFVLRNQKPCLENLNFKKGFDFI